MRLKPTIQFLLTMLAILGIFLVFQSSTPVSKDDSSNESMNDCCKKKTTSDKMIWENLSQQFFSTL
ncbi:hypothetical protein [Terrimonas pollutisoli]|uniref:hypothetical protein n=1 Tax=Terrimonas pollutisoli TaxID=3034147 RepID=UPI0023EB119B|nr:hypothetical protein [Terrimonas sp. H1YJ31]